MAEALGKNHDAILAKMREIKTGYGTLWTRKGYKSGDVISPDDRANALAVLSGLAEKDQYDVIAGVLSKTHNASPYMEYYVLEALCRMDRYGEAKRRMLQRYKDMIADEDSTLWEKWSKYSGTRNHAWSGGPLVIMSKYFAGVRPVKAGYTEFVIKPELTQAGSVRCVVPSVKGYIRVTETKTDHSFTLDASVPEETKAFIYLPYADGQTVKLNDVVLYRNNAFAKTDGIECLETDNGYIVFSAASSVNHHWVFEVSDERLHQNNVAA